MIDQDTLFTWGAVAKHYERGEVIFREGNLPRFYYQIIDGKISMFHLSEEGREFIQGIFKSGDSFGEPPLLLGKPYPTTASVLVPTTVLQLRRNVFLEMLADNPSICQRFLFVMAQRVYDKAVAASSIINEPAEKRILALLERIKETEHPNTPTPVLIAYSRQRLADMCGLRVETLIRELAKMNEKGQVSIQNRKLYF